MAVHFTAYFQLMETLSLSFRYWTSFTYIAARPVVPELSCRIMDLFWTVYIVSEALCNDYIGLHLYMHNVIIYILSWLLQPIFKHCLLAS